MPFKSTTITKIVSEPNLSTLVSSLRSCVQTRSPADGYLLHAHVVESFFDHVPELCNLLVQVYAGCGDFHDALALFARSSPHDAGIFCVLLQECARLAKNQIAFDIFDQMRQEGFLPNREDYISILSLCAAQQDVRVGRQVHSTLFWGSTTAGDDALYTILLNMYGKGGNIDESRKAFDAIKSRDVVCWTAMISIYANHHQGLEALHIFDRMLQVEVTPNGATLVSVLKSCVCLGDVSMGQLTHHLIYEFGYELHILGGNILIHFYNTCACVEDAERTFQAMSKRDVTTWNAIITAHVSHGQDIEALHHFARMLDSVLFPNSVTFISVLPICKSSELLTVGEWLHSLILDRDLESDIKVCNALLAMYGKCSCLESMQEFFGQMPSQDVVSWNTLISACGQSKDRNFAFQQVKRMEHEGISLDKVTYFIILGLCNGQMMMEAGQQIHVSILNNHFETDPKVGNALVGMYSRCCDSKHALFVFNNMPRKDALSCAPIIEALIAEGDINIAFQTFNQASQEGFLPSNNTSRAMLSACATPNMQAAGRRMHAYVQGRGLGSSVTIVNALLHMYGKIGVWQDTWIVFETAILHDLISWNTMVTACAYQGCSQKAMYMFNQMQMEGALPDKVSFLAALSAYWDASKLKGGILLHAHLCATRFGGDVDIRNALLSMYGRCSRVTDARGIFDELVSNCIELLTTWNVMISVYAKQGQGANALLLFRQMQLCGQMATPATFVSMLSVCHSGIGLPEGIMIHACIQYRWFEKVAAVDNALINMYGKCGDMAAAQTVFDNMLVQDLISWTTLISSYAQHGQTSQASNYSRKMQSKGWLRNNITLSSLLNGFTYTGLLDPCIDLVMQTGDAPMVIIDHFVNVVGLLVRAGQLEEAEQLSKCLPGSNLVIYMTLFAGCRQKMDVE